MRKFTKEITALMASIAVSTAVGAASASSEEIVQTAGVATTPTEVIIPTEIPTTAGVPLPPDDYIEPTEPTTEEFPPLAGEPLPPDEYIETTEPTTEEFPPLAGEPLPPDEYIETTEPTTEEFPPLVGDVAIPDGDVDGNGSFNAADVVSFSKYLLNKSDEAPDNLYAADLCTDGKINVFDLVIMKREMISQKQFDDTPVLLIDDYIINDWDSEFYERVITADGNRYSRPLCDCAFLSVDDHMNHIKDEGEKEQFITDTEILQKISVFSKNAAKYKECEMKELDLTFLDPGSLYYGDQTLYVLYNDENGIMQQLQLCRFGGEFAWLDNTEVQEFVTLLIEKGYFADSDIFEAYLKNKE